MPIINPMLVNPMLVFALTFTSFILPCHLAAHPEVLRDVIVRSVPPTIQLITITIPTSFLPSPLTYGWTWEAQTSNAVPFAQIVTSPEGLLPLVLMPPSNPGNTGWNLAGVDQLTSTISINSNNFGFVAFIDEDTRELSSCKIDIRNPTVILSQTGGATETVSAQVLCSTPFNP